MAKLAFSAEKTGTILLYCTSIGAILISVFFGNQVSKIVVLLHRSYIF